MDKILKFGGSSVETLERVQNVVNIIAKSYQKTPRIAVVASAFGGVTDALIALGKEASTGKSYQKGLARLIERHQDEGLMPSFQELQKILEGVFLIQELSLKTLDQIMSFGERWSCFLLAQALKKKIPEAFFLDARKIIKTNRFFGKAGVDFEATNQNIQTFFKEHSGIAVVTGFIGSSHEGETTTLGRGGSDYTAAILGAALDVSLIEIWTDVDGVMTADPRKEPYAFPIREMSYKEAMEMSYFGAKVIHPPTIIPAFEKKIPLLIKNSFNPEAKGTLIDLRSSNFTISGISSIDRVSLLSLQGSGMVGVCGIAKRLFGAMAEKGINIILISQGSSEQSICFAILPSFVNDAVEAIKQEFFLEMQAGIIDAILVEKDLSVVAVVGENMRHTSGIAGKLFGALGKNGVNVIAIAQGSSELNISTVVKKEDEVKAIRVIHEAFFLSPKKTLNLFLVGTGLIGEGFLKKVESFTSEAIDLSVRGVANSKKMTFDGLEEPMEIRRFIQKMLGMNLINTVFIDCTSNQEITNHYETILEANVAIVTPNKKANSGPYKTYKKLQEIVKKKGVAFSYGANVGAGLPMISTIQELILSGDKILKIEAILSGTLSYLFNHFKKGHPFSEVVKEAEKKGYTEPDPRDDLKGMDVARKLLILSRISGYAVEMEDIVIEKILPNEYFEGSLGDFYEKLKLYDATLEKRRQDAEKEGKVLRYIATFEKGKGVLSLQAIGASHPFYHLSGNDNILAITSTFYRENPLVIKGQGAGKEVTCGKVFADVIRLAT